MTNNMNKKYKKNNNPEEREDIDTTLNEQNENIEETDDILSEEEEQTQELEKLQDEYNTLNDKYLRLNAEFDNFRKRTIREKAELIKSGGERVLTEIITLVDDFERALASMNDAKDKSALLEGMELIYSKFIQFIEQHGVKEIEVIGKEFDPEHSEAVTTIPTEDESQKGMVIDCIQKGYKLNDKIIRYPKVIVGE